MDFSQPPFSTWCHGLTLAERRTLLLEGRNGPETDSDGLELGLRRLQRWRAQPPFDDEAVLDQRLACEGLDLGRFAQILGASPENLGERLDSPPRWLAELQTAYAQESSTVVELPSGEEMLGFLELVQPLVDQACHRLAIGVAELAEKWLMLPFDHETIEDVLLVNLADPLLMRLGRTMALELNVARLQGLLPGETPEERFQSFLKHLHQSLNAVAILAEYPVLARQLTICIDQWVDVSLEFLSHLCADWTTIRAHFCPDQDPGLLVNLIGGAGDTHRNGHSVMIVEFESGFRVVYKPKSLAVDLHFQELLTWLNDRGCHPTLGTLTMLDREEYGWVEHVAYEDCNSLDEVKRFYRRLGLHLALLYAINASDFHLENLIAAGEHPVLIDLETLFNPEFERYEEGDAETEASRAMMRSVLVVAMLPQRLWSVNDYAGIDISGLGGEAGQLSPDRTPQPTEVGTDAMRYVRGRIELPGEANRPTFDGVESSAIDYVEDIVAGFVDMYHLLVKHRTELLADDGPIACFGHDEIRVLLRPTRTYDQLLYESFHPDMLRDGLERDRLLDRLWIVVPERAHMADAVATEQAELQLGDIPIFTTQPRSLGLWSGSGQRLDSILVETGMDLACGRIEELGDQDMRRQIWFIRSTLATLVPTNVDIDFPPTTTYQLSPTADTASRANLFDASRQVAERLSDTALLGETNITWIGLESILDEAWDVGPLGIDLYGGVAGIGLFLAYAGARFDDARYTSLARRAHTSISAYVTQANEDVPGIGGYDGWGGLLYTLTHMGSLWSDPAIFTQASELVGVIARFVDEDEAFDLVRGSAGAAGSLLAYYRCTADERALAAAVSCGEHLLASAQEMEQGIGWVIPRFGMRPLSGFAHGAAGIAWALLELASASGDDRYRIAATQTIDYERSLYAAEAMNWTDLRRADLATNDDEAVAAKSAVAWCHGAAGIGMARMRALRHLDDPDLYAEIDIALQTTLTHGFGQSHSLCHGDLGNLELLIQAGQFLGDSHWRTEADRVSAMVLASIEQDGWQCGGPQAVETPSLMLGLAGIGYGLLRLAAPDQVPSILLLEPPMFGITTTFE